mgnify:CR=1 FL=1
MCYQHSMECRLRVSHLHSLLQDVSSYMPAVLEQRKVQQRQRCQRIAKAQPGVWERMRMSENE